MSSTFFCPHFSSPFVNKMALSTSRVLPGEVFNATCMKKEVWLTFLRRTSSPSPERYLLPNERTWFGKEKETVQMPQTFSVVIGRRSQDWMTTDRWTIEAQTGITYIAVALLVTFHKLFFQPQAFSLSLHEKFCLHSFRRSLYKAGLWTVIFVPFGLETSDRRKPAKCLSPRRDANKII